MKLNEIYSDKTLYQFISYIRTKTNIRNGKFSFVFQPEGKDYVYKAWTNDSVWDAYLKIIDSSNPYFPKIEKIKQVPLKFSDKNLNVKIAKIEKLYPCNVLNIIKIPAIRKSDNKEITLDILRLSSEIENINDLYVIADRYQNQYQDLFDALLTIRNLRNNNNDIGIDFKDDNFMQRQDGHLVINDPLSDTTGVESIVGSAWISKQIV